MRLTARAHLALTLAVTTAAVCTRLPDPVPAHAGDFLGSGHVTTVSRQVGAFTALRVEGPVDIHAHPGTPGAITVRADDNVVPMIETVVDGNTLVVRVARNASFRTSNSMTVDVSFAQLDTLRVRGSGDVRIDQLNGPRFEATISGSGDLVVGRATLGTLVTEIEGSGDMTFSGTADEARFSIAGSGDVRASELRARRVTVSIAGSGDANVYASESLDAHVAGSGDVRYGGRPPQVNRHVAGSGDIEPM